MENNLKGESKWIGDKSELSVAHKLVMLDVGVSKPMGDNLPYDLIMDINNKLYRIQVKTARLQNNGDTLNAHTGRSIIGKDKKYKNYTYTKEEIDYFAIHCIDNNETCLIPITEAENARSITVRRVQAKNNQNSSVRFIEDCLLENVIEKLRNDEEVITKQSTRKEREVEHPHLPPKHSYALKRIGPSGYRGVTHSTKGNCKWEAYIRSKGKNIFIGRSNDARELAKLYDSRAVAELGNVAITNRMLGLL